jgi:transcriptional regulator GlxA family with amidase domain
MTRVVLVLVPGVHLLDLAGPAQAFSSAASRGYDYQLSYVSETTEVVTAQGLPLVTATQWPALDSEDLILVPGWRGVTLTTAPIGEETLARLREHHAAGGTVASVCAGAEALGRAGLLDGRRFTTHHNLQDQLAQRYPQATVVRDVLYVVDDRVVTSAGIASGIDLALHLIAGQHGPGAAGRVARDMVVYARRNGNEPQTSALLRHRSHLNDAVHRIQDVIEARFTDRLSLADLAAESGCSERTVTRLFGRATGLTPLRYQHILRVERAEHLIGHGATVESAARAVGFEDARMLRRLRSRAS